MQQYQYRKICLIFLLAFVVTMLVTATGCGGGTSSASNPPGPTPTPTPSPTPAAGQLALTPANMNFGNVTVGSNASQSGSLTAGSTGITVSSASWNGSGYSLSGITFPVTIPPGQSVPFTVKFAPQAAGLSTGNVSFTSNATNSPGSESLSGSGVMQHSVALSWIASPSSIVGYNVYRGTQTGGPYTRVNASVQPTTSFSDTSVVAGATYFYVVTAIDSSSQESAFSNEANAVVPTP